MCITFPHSAVKCTVTVTNANVRSVTLHITLAGQVKPGSICKPGDPELVSLVRNGVPPTEAVREGVQLIRIHLPEPRPGLLCTIHPRHNNNSLGETGMYLFCM